MDRYIGIDAHLESCTVTIMGPSGRRIREERLETDAKVLADCMRRIPGRRHVCIEEGQQSEWLYELLEPLTDELVVVQAEAHRGNKNDSLDAWGLADAMRRGNLARFVFKAPGRFTELRNAIHAYDQVIGDVVRIKNRLKSLYGGRGLRCTGKEVYDPLKRQAWVSKLPPAQQQRAKLLNDELDHLTDVQDEADTWVRNVAKRTPEVVRLMTAPGIGEIRGAQIVAVVVSPYRFRTRGQFWSYCGLAVVTRSSSDWTRGRDGRWLRKETTQTRGLTRSFNRRMKNVFKGAAKTVAGMKEDPLATRYEELLENGTKPNLALLTIARRLAAIVLAMWKHGEDYNPQKCFGKAK